MEFKDRIKYLREQKGWTKKLTAKKIGISVSAYANYEYGNREPNQEITKKIASTFQVPVSLLIDENITDYDDLLINFENVTDLIIDATEKLEKKMEISYIKAFEKLNDDGQEMLFKYADFLSQQNEYKRTNNIKIDIELPKQD